MPESTTIGGARLTVSDIDAVARAGTAVRIDPAAGVRMERSYAFVQRLARGSTPIYGLTTGCGPLAAHRISPEQREAFQRNLIRSHAVTLGAAHPTTFVRAAMAARAHVLAQGYSGIDPHAVALLVAMLNAGVHPVVREVGAVGASGDLVELAQIALALLGEGEVESDGRVRPAADSLRALAIAPLVPRFREGLALMNGTSFHTGTGALLVQRGRRILAAAHIAAAMVFEVLHARIEALDPALHAARPHPGQQSVAARLAQLVAGSSLVRSDAAGMAQQDAYTLRCIPQILGPVLTTLEATADTIEVELNSVTDNPLFLVDEERVVHGGNFHGQPVALGLDQLKIAMVELGVLSERRLARLLDGKLNAGLPAFLIRDDAGLRSGFMGLQYCASSMAADNAVLAAPTSVHSVSTNANNQDVVSMGMVAARHAHQVIENVERMVAIELLCAAQALDLRGSVHAGAGSRAAHALIRAHATPLLDDRPLQTDVEAVRRLIDDGTLQATVDKQLS